MTMENEEQERHETTEVPLRLSGGELGILMIMLSQLTGQPATFNAKGRDWFLGAINKLRQAAHVAWEEPGEFKPFTAEEIFRVPSLADMARLAAREAGASDEDTEALAKEFSRKNLN